MFFSRKIIPVLMMLTAAVYGEGFTAFENGKWMADIVLPEKANQAETFAANELRYHLGKALGKTPEIIRENEKSACARHFYIGNVRAAAAAGIKKAALPMDSRLIRTVGDGIVFTGGDRDGSKVGNGWSAACQGTLYAVYDFLENELGVRWIWPGELGEVIPKRTSLDIKKTDRSGKEPLTARRLRVAGRDGRRLIGWSKLENRERFFEAQELFLIRHRMGASENLFYGHAFSNYWKRFGKKEPSFFALLPNGKREPLAGDESGSFITLCVSQPKLWDQIILDWRKSGSRRPGSRPYMPLINLCENDSPGMCTCPACRAWDSKDPRFASSKYWGKGEDPLTKRGRFLRLARVNWGEDGDAKNPDASPSLSDRYAKFYMTVLKEAKKVSPSARVIGYAYANYTDAPVETKLDKDVVLCYVPQTGLAYTDAESRIFRKQWSGWRKAGVKDIVLRPNYMLMGANMPLNRGRVIADDFAFAAGNGMIGTNFDSLTGMFASQGAMLYTLVRIHREPGFGYENACREFCSAFAPAEKEIRAYIDFWEKFSNPLSEEKCRKAGADNRDRFGNFGGGHTNFFLVAAALYPPDVFDQARKILDAAAKRAAGNEPVLRRIDFLRKGLQDAELTRNCRAAQKKWKDCKDRTKRAELHEAFEKTFRAMIDFRASVEGDGVANFGYLADYEKFSAGLPHKIEKITKK